ncbi:MAG: hypothetical protein ACRBI6_10020 [Acidimicrobiales bacterium]
MEATRNRRARHVTFGVIAFIALNGVGALLLADFGGGDDEGDFDIDVQGSVAEADAGSSVDDRTVDGDRPVTTVEFETINSLLAEDGTITAADSSTTEAPTTSTTQVPATTQSPTTRAPATTQRTSTTQRPVTTAPTTTTTAPPTTPPPTPAPTPPPTSATTTPVPTFSIPDGGDIASSVVERLPEVVLPGDDQ